MKTEANQGRDVVKSVNTTFRILEHLKDNDGDTLTNVADEIGVVKSTVHRHFTTLLQNGYVIEEDGEYYPSFRFVEFGEYAKTKKDAYVMAEKKVKELVEETEERVQFMVEQHGRVVYLHRKTGQRAVQTDPGLGKQVDIHASSAGKAVLADLPQEYVDDIIDRWGLPRLTEHTTTDRDELFEELETIREQGYAFNDQENIEGLRAVGVSITDTDGEVLGALSVSGPTHRLKGDWYREEIPDLLLGTANEVELNIHHA